MERGKLTLDQKRVGIFEVDVHHTHYPNTHQHRLVRRAQLGLVIGTDRGRGELRLLASHGRSRFDIFQRCVICFAKERKKKISSPPTKAISGGGREKSERTVLLLDNYSTIHVQPEDDQIGEDVHPPDAVEPQRVFEGDLLRHLHHAQDHDEVGSAHLSVSDPPDNSSSSAAYICGFMVTVV